MHIIEKVKSVCRNNPQRVLFAEANDHRIIEAARYLTDNKLAYPILIGGVFTIREMASELNISTKGLKIINHKHKNEYYPYIEQIRKKEKFKNLDKKDIELFLNDALNYALIRLEYGLVDFVLAGNMSTMRRIAKSALNIIGGCSRYTRVSSFYFLISADQNTEYIFADCSLNINPSSATMAEIAIKTSQIFSNLTKKEPRVAFLSFSTKGSANPENVDKIKEAVSIVKKTEPSVLCDGEIQFDAAIDLSIAEKKGANNILNGKANVFIFPTLDSANIGQKIAEQIGGFLSIGPMILGLRKDIHHLPKSCSVDNIINSALFASFLKIQN